MISQELVDRSPFRAYIIAIKPDARLSDVMKLGICFIMGIIIQKESKIKINFIKGNY
jgi:hypothetical protein